MMRDEQELAGIEAKYEDAKSVRFRKNLEWKAAKAKYHTQLVARREAGEKLTIKDMEALEDLSIDEVPEVKTAYLAFVQADGEYRKAKVSWESAKREYWDSKGR